MASGFSILNLKEQNGRHFIGQIKTQIQPQHFSFLAHENEIRETDEDGKSISFESAIQEANELLVASRR